MELYIVDNTHSVVIVDNTHSVVIVDITHSVVDEVDLRLSAY